MSFQASVYRRLRHAVLRRELAVLATVAAAPNKAEVGQKALLLWGGEGWVNAEGRVPPTLVAAVAQKADAMLARGQRAALTTEDETPGFRVAIEVFPPKPRLIIAGAGHVAVPTHALAADAGFWVGVLDDRAAFANPQRFPKADLVVCEPFSKGLQTMEVDSDSFVAVVTRGHLHDLEVLLELHRLNIVPAYLGMIGSRRRALTVFEKLKQSGVPPSFIERIYSPIGLDIGAESPFEIGLAIVAEMVAARRGRKGGHLRSKEGRRHDGVAG